MKVKKTIYMDYQASTPLNNEVLEKMIPFFTEEYANPHSNDHAMGWKAAKAVDDAKSLIAESIGADSNELIFTSGATESNNHAILNHAMNISSSKTKILVGSTEHKCILEAARHVAQNHNLTLEFIPVTEEGFIDLNAFEKMLDDDVGLISVMLVNNEVGTIQDIKYLVNMAKKHGALFHCDAAQAPLAVDINVKDLGVDSLSLSAHKIYGPKGVGALYISAEMGRKNHPLIFGGNQQEGLRAGTLSTPLCVGFSHAYSLLKDYTNERNRLRELKQLFLSKITQTVECHLNGPADTMQSHPGNINLYFPYIDGHELLMKLQPHVCASSGSACNSGLIEPSYVIKALGHSYHRAENSIRFSLGSNTNESEIIQCIELINRVTS